MKKSDFNSLLQAAKEFKQLKAGKIKPARVFDFTIDVQQIRKDFKMSQSQFAGFLNIPLKTLINWEQGRSSPTGAACSLLLVAQRQPKAVIMALHRE